MYWIASPTVTIFSASSSGIWRSKCSSRAMTSSTVSSESAPRSSMNFAVGVTSSSSTPSCSTMISFTFSSTGFAMNPSPPRKGELHIETAVDVEDLARDVGRPVSGEESYHLGHLSRGADALERHLGHERGACRCGNVRGHIGLDQPRGHRVHQNRPVRQLARRRLRESDEPGLCRGVVHLAGVAHGAGGRRDIDDAATALLSDQHLRHGARHQERAAEVHLDHPIPVLILHPHEELVVRDAGVVDEDIDASKLLPRRAHEAIAVVTARRVGDDAERRAPLRFKIFHHALQTVAVAPRDYHGRAVLGQPRADGRADPAPAAGDDRDLAVERALHEPPATAASARSTPAGSSTDWPRAPLTMRRSSPVSTRPGPTSTYAVAPSPASRWTQSAQRTGLATCFSRKGRTSSARRVTSPSTFRTTGIAGSETERASSSRASLAAAGAISEQWNGALTGSITLILPPRAAASATARSTAARWPAITI